jgi:hypothetical protein
VEQPVQARLAQADPPLPLDQGLRPPGRPLVAVQAVVRRGLAQQDVAQHPPPRFRQRLRDAPPLRGHQRLEAPVQEHVHPVLQGLPPEVLARADLRHALAVPQPLDGQQAPPGALRLVPVVQLLPFLPVPGGQPLDADGAVHNASLSWACQVHLKG